MTVPEEVAQTIRSFFAALGKGDWKTASSLVTDPIDVFGATALRAAFATGLDRTIGAEVSTLTTVPLSFFQPHEHTSLFGGPVPDGARICFATVPVGGQPTTYGVLVQDEAGAARVARLFDPTPFKLFAESLDAARRGVEQVGWK